jgi:hypothetical protein
MVKSGCKNAKLFFVEPQIYAPAWESYSVPVPYNPATKAILAPREGPAAAIASANGLARSI